MSSGGVDVLVVSLGSTGGLRVADEELAGSLRRAGANVEIARAARPREVRTFALTDLSWALAARRAARDAIQRHRPRAVIYSSVTAALLWPRVGAIRLDSLAAASRPGRHGFWQRPVERRRLASAPLVVPYAEPLREQHAGWTGAGVLHAGKRGADEYRGGGGGGGAGVPRVVEPWLPESARGKTVVVAMPVEPSGPVDGERDIDAITYAANPAKKGLRRVLEAWESARRPGERLLVTGTSERELSRAGISLPGEGVEATGMLHGVRYRELLRRARVYVCAPAREDYGTAQLEALADGCMLVTTRAPGPYVALPITERLDRRMVGEDLAGALRVALDDPPRDYRERAARELAPLRREAVDRVVAGQLLPRLLQGPGR